MFGANQYALAQTPDFRFFVGGPGIVEGLPSFAVKPGDSIIIYALGCGPTTPAVPAGTKSIDAQILGLDQHFDPVVNFWNHKNRRKRSVPTRRLIEGSIRTS